MRIHTKPQRPPSLRRRRPRKRVLQDVMRRLTYRLRHTKAQERELEILLEWVRKFYNRMRRYCIESWQEVGRYPTRNELNTLLKEWRGMYPEMEDVPTSIQRGTIERVIQAFKSYQRNKREYDKQKKNGKNPKVPSLPKFKESKDFTSILAISGIKIEKDELYIPKPKSVNFEPNPNSEIKLGSFRIRRKGGNPYKRGTPRTATLLKKCDRWYVSVVFKVQVPKPVDNGKVLGVDRNVRQIADSDGRIQWMPDVTKWEKQQIFYEQKASRCRKGSANHKKLQAKIAKTKVKIARIKHNHNHHISKDLARRAGTIILEKLNLKNMMQSARGTLENPGTNVAAKTGLNRVLQGSNLFQLQTMLEYKAHIVLYVNPRNTSRTCHVCGHVAEENRKGQTFECLKCGHSDHADINAALNIRASGIDALTRERCL